MSGDLSELFLCNQESRPDPALPLVAAIERFTFLQTCSTIENADSITLVVDL
jgi:hypothetical protein